TSAGILKSQTKAEIASLLLRVGDPDDHLVAGRKWSGKQCCAAVVARTQFHGDGARLPVSADYPHRCRTRGRGLAGGFAAGFRPGAAWPKPQCLAGNFENVANIAHRDAKLGGHSRQEQKVWIWSGDDCRVCDDVLRKLGRLADLQDLPAESSIRIGIHCEL